MIINNDSKTYFSNNGLQTTDESGRTNYLPTNFDWLDMNIAYFTYSTANLIDVASTVDTLGSFQIGDRLEITQTTVKYFYVISVSTTQIGITGGTDYTYTSGAISRIRLSRQKKPSGFPDVFNWNANERTPDPNYLSTGAGYTKSMQFHLDGAFCTIDLHFDQYSLSGDSSAIVFNLPIPCNSTFLLNANAPFYPCFAVNDFIIQTAGAKLIDGGWDVEVSIIEFPGTDGFGVWTTSTNGVGLDITLTYLV